MKSVLEFALFAARNPGEVRRASSELLQTMGEVASELIKHRRRELALAGIAIPTLAVLITVRRSTILASQAMLFALEHRRRNRQ